MPIFFCSWRNLLSTLLTLRITIPSLTTGRVGGYQPRVDRGAEAALHGVPRRRQEEEGRRALRGQLQDGQVKQVSAAALPRLNGLQGQYQGQSRP